MVFSQFESTDAGQVATAGYDQSLSASSRMLAEVQNQASDRSNTTAKCITLNGDNAGPADGKCLALSRQQLNEMLGGFAIDDQSSLLPPSRPADTPSGITSGTRADTALPGTVRGRGGHEAGQAELSEKTQQKLGGKPWRPEYGVCAPGSPYKIDCKDDKSEAQGGN